MAGLCLFALTACAPSPSSVPAAAAPQARLTWLVCVNGASGEEDFFAHNRIGRLLSAAMGEAPALTFSAQDAVTAFSQRIATGSLPDLFTASAQDDVLRLCEKDTYTYDLPEALTRGGGHGVPGGFGGDTSAPARFCEGIYVRRKDLVGRRVYDQTAFIALLQQIIRQDGRQPPLGQDQSYPILFDTGNTPFMTLEHLFGIQPFYTEGGRTGHRIFADNWLPLLTFLQQLQHATGCTALWVPPEPQTALLDGTVHVYIGRHAPAVYANLHLAPEDQFVPIYPSFSDDGFLQVYSRSGLYRTFVCRNGNDTYARAADCLQALVTAEASRAAVLGEEGRDWIFDSGQGRPVPLHSQQTEEEALRQGIGRFPFLSSIGMGNKGYDGPMKPLDLLDSQAVGSLYADDSDSIYILSLEAKIAAVLKEAMTSRHLSRAELADKLGGLRRSEELMCLPIGLP